MKKSFGQIRKEVNRILYNMKTMRVNQFIVNQFLYSTVKFLVEKLTDWFNQQ